MPRTATVRSRPPRVSSHQAGRAFGFAALVAAVVWALLAFNLLPRALQVAEGEVSQANLRSPRKLTYTSQVKTKAERDRAAAAVQEVVEIAPAVVQRQRAGLNGLLQGISAARNTPGLAPDQRRAQMARLGPPPPDEAAVTWLGSLA